MSARGRPSFFTFGIAGTIVFFGACGDGGESGGDFPIESFAAAFADALCNNIGPCCQQEGFVYDAVTCRAKTAFVLGGEAVQMQKKGIPYDPKGARACVEVVASLARSCSSDDTEAAYHAACGRVYAGHQPEGANCTSGFQCASKDCVRPSGGGPQLCGGSNAPQHGKPGDGCSATCFRNSASGIVNCMPLDFGATISGVQCFGDEWLFCDRATRTCALQPDIGEPCDVAHACRSDAFCEDGLCAAKRTSGSCGPEFNGCASSAFCSTGTPRECQPRRDRGAACGFDDQCAATTECAANTCRGVTLANKDTCK